MSAFEPVGNQRLQGPRLLGRAVRALAATALPYQAGRLLTTSEVVSTPQAKSECFRAHGALAVDMESAHVLDWARALGIPALGVRVVADGPADLLPAPLTGAVGPEGHVRPGAVLGWIRQPALLPSAWRVWRRARVGLDRLGRFVRAFADTRIEP